MSIARIPLVLALLVAVGAAGCGAGGDSTHSASTTTASPKRIDACLRVGDGTRAASFPSNGKPLKGALIGSGDTAVVFANESGNDLCPWKHLAATLRMRGVESALFTYRDVGSPKELGSVVEAVRADGAKRVVVVGASVGGRAVVQLAATPGSGIDAAVSLSGERFLPNAEATDLLPSARKAKVPVLYVGAKGDGLVRAGLDTHQLFAAGKHAPGTKQLVIGSFEHGTQMLPIPAVHSAVLRAIGH